MGEKRLNCVAGPRGGCVVYIDTIHKRSIVGYVIFRKGNIHKLEGVGYYIGNASTP